MKFSRHIFQSLGLSLGLELQVSMSSLGLKIWEVLRLKILEGEENFKSTIK